jgi:regulator of sigma E protease
MEIPVIIIKGAQLLLSLSILVVLHELGHFIPAKLFKTKVEKFYLFFDPWFSVFKTKIGDTEYGIGWLPLGGYVKIAGMIDESMDKEQMALPPQPWEFRSKPAWQRLIIMLGGVTVNVILAFVIYLFTLFAYGEKFLPAQNAEAGVYCDSLGVVAGFQNGDMLYSVDGVELEKFAHSNGALHKEVIEKLILNDANVVTVIREGSKVGIPFTEEVKLAMLDKNRLFSPNLPFVIAGFSDSSVAQQYGAIEGDKIVRINDKDMFYAGNVMDYVPTLVGDSVKLVLERGQEEVELNFLLESERLGVTLMPFASQFQLEEEKYTLLSAFPAAIAKTKSEINNYFKQFRLIKKSPDSVGGFISIGGIFPNQWHWQSFWEITALLSIMLAVLNLLPIPALDGGHVMFLLYEVITGRKPHEKVMEVAQTIGIILLMGLVLYANGNDIFKLLS